MDAAHCEFRQVQQMTDAPVEFGLIPKDDWYQPEWIDEERARSARERMMKLNVIYGGSVPCVQPICPDCTRSDAQCRYRNMCRFNSGVRLLSRGTIGSV